MKAIILAAGYGTRLYPLTKNTPKQLLDISGKTVLDRILGKISSAVEIDEVFLVTNDFFYPMFVEWKEKQNLTKPFTVVNDGTRTAEDRLGAIGDIEFTIRTQNIQDDVLVWGGDTLFGFDVQDSINFFKEKGSSVVGGKFVPERSFLASRFGVIESGEDEKVISFEEKPEQPKSNIASLCYYIFKKEDLHKITDCVASGNIDNSGDFIKYLLEHSPVHCFSYEGEWFDIGGFDTLEAAREFYKGK